MRYGFEMTFACINSEESRGEELSIQDLTPTLVSLKCFT